MENWTRVRIIVVVVVTGGTVLLLVVISESLIDIIGVTVDRVGTGLTY